MKASNIKYCLAQSLKLSGSTQKTRSWKRADGSMAALRLYESAMIACEWDGVDPTSQRDIRYPRPDETSRVPGVDEMGRVLAVTREDGGHDGFDYYYARRSRSLCPCTSPQVHAFVRADKDHQAEALRLAVMARALFWERMRALRALDAE
jgi:hypothetical protein